MFEFKVEIYEFQVEMHRTGKLGHVGHVGPSNFGPNVKT